MVRAGRRSSRTATEALAVETDSFSRIPAQAARAMGAGAREVLDEHTYAFIARGAIDLPRARESGDGGMADERSPSCPAFNEAGAIGDVVDAIRAVDPAYDVVVVDDGSADETGPIARAHGAAVVTLPYNIGIGGTVQTGFKYALERGYATAVRLDGDGQHDPAELGKLLRPIQSGEADIVTGSRFVDGSGEYRPPLARRIGIIWFARIVSLLYAAACHRHDLRLPGAESQGHFARGRLPERLPRGRGHGTRLQASATARRGPGDDARARDGPVVDHVRPLDLLRREGDSGVARRDGEAVRHAPRGGGSAMTSVRTSVAAAIASLLLILIVLELIRGRRLKERYALLWLVTGVVLFVLSIWRQGLNTIAGWLGVETYPPAILFAIATLFIIVVLLHYSTVLSQLDDQNTILAQRVALLEERIHGAPSAAGDDTAPKVTSRAFLRRGGRRPRGTRASLRPGDAPRDGAGRLRRRRKRRWDIRKARADPGR